VTWVTWRQFRVSAIAVGLGLAVVALLLAVTPQGREVASCAGQSGCPIVADKFLGIGHVHLLDYLSTLLVGLPVIIGAFWGAPVVARELETGTYRLAWSQSVTRTRWFLTKIGLIGVAAAASCGFLSLMLGAWSSASVNSGRLLPAMFAQRGVVPVGYALFAFALGVAAGVLIRRTVPAIIATLVGYVAVRAMVQFFLRPHLQPLLHANFRIGNGLGINFVENSGTLSLLPPPDGLPNTWVVSRTLADKAGHAPSAAFVRSACGNRLPGPPPNAFRNGSSHAAPTGAAARGIHDCIASVAARFHEVAAYQPLSHYWGLQWAETGIFVAAALALLAFSFWWVSRRLT
jgi:hypothetical protein